MVPFSGRLYITWLLVVTVIYIYNACVIPLRSVFTHYQTDDNLAWWLTADCFADLIYIIDIVVFKSRVMYLDNGFWISSSSLMRRHYLKTARFWVCVWIFHFLFIFFIGYLDWKIDFYVLMCCCNIISLIVSYALTVTISELFSLL